ncbi:MAG: AMP-binding protein, partial [Microthrixaceae bacterium]
MTFPGVHARERPDHPAVVMAASGETVTYRELDERSNRLAQLWHARGLRRGDHVAILLPNG